MSYKFTQNDIVQQLSALRDSMNVIDAIIAFNDRSDEQLDPMDRNIRHIEIMCAMPHLADQDLTPYMDAASRGSAWLAQN